MLNEFLDLKSGINLVYGEGGTGKTTLALMLTRNYSKFGKVIFIDTENGFNFERFKQISQEYYEGCLKNILLFKIKNFEEQIKIIKKIEKINKISLLIIDTIGSQYRLELQKNPKEINKKMGGLLKILKILKDKGINVFLTNQVYNNFKNDKIESVGGDMIKKFCKEVIRLKRNPRTLIKEKSSKIEYQFDIKNEGIVFQ
jgi:DNA repair protein RadB